MSSRSDPPSNAELEMLYLDEGWSVRAIADHFDVSPPTARRWLVRAGIEPRSRREQQRIDAQRGDAAPLPDADILRARIEAGDDDPEHMIERLAALHAVDRRRIERLVYGQRGAPTKGQDEDIAACQIPVPARDELVELYERRKSSMREIGRRYDVSQPTVRKWLDIHGIAVRSSAQTQRLDPPADLRSLYVDELRPMAWIARREEVVTGTVRRWLADAGIERRSLAERRAAKHERRLREPPDDLRNLYVDELWSEHALMKHYGVSRPLIEGWLERLDIERRTAQQQRAIAIERMRCQAPDDLRERYVGARQSMAEIAEAEDVAIGTVRRWLEDAEVEIRSQGRQNQIGNARRRAEFDTEVGRPERADLVEHYHGAGMTLAQVAEHYDVNESTVTRWFEEGDIERRSISEAKMRQRDREIGAPPHDLRARYVDDECSMTELAHAYSVSVHTVGAWLDSLGVAPRSGAEQQRIDGERRRKAQSIERPSNRELARLYRIERLSMNAIAEQLGTHGPQVAQWLDEAGIERRTGREQLQISSASQRGQPPDDLVELYVEQRCSMSELGQRYGVSRYHVRCWLIELGIERRSAGQQSRVATPRPQRVELIRWYRDDDMTIEEIADAQGVSVPVVTTWMEDYEIPRRTASESRRLSASRQQAEDIPPADLHQLYVVEQRTAAELLAHYGVGHQRLHRWLSQAGIVPRSRADATRLSSTRRREPPGQLRTLYVDQRRSMNALAGRFGVSRDVVRRWLDELGIERRSRRAQQRLSIGRDD